MTTRNPSKKTTQMSSEESCVIIVESPAKVKTIQKYLEKDSFNKKFQVFASYGHVRDLLPKQGAVDTEHDFAMTYAPLEKNAKHVSAIASALKKADAIYFATDPDREGEAISWHLSEMLKDKGILKDKAIRRIVFYEITKSAIHQAIENPRQIDTSLVDAYKARRGLDFLVGYNLSPVLWRKVRPGLSAGRVQSPALRMIVEREEEIEQFKPQEYWTIKAKLGEENKAFWAKLAEFDGEKIKQFSITHEKQAKSIEEALIESAEGKLIVKSIEKKQRKRNPAPPFITSTLQQEAARKLGFTTDRTMRVAQQLYEGIDIGQGPLGLITYMRTDSVNLADEAIKQLRQFIGKKYGKDFVPETPNHFKKKSKNAQEAHEGIRPTEVSRTPDMLKAHLSIDQLKLYTLIWKRTVACQMIYAVLNQVAIHLLCGNKHLFKATGSTIAHPGFMSVYLEGTDDSNVDDSKEQPLPELKEGQEVPLLGIETLQHFTEPPPRYTEASLVKALEEHGIGRPSTYASIIYTLKQRKYVELDKKRFIPTDVGRVVKKFLTLYFTQYVDYEFTAKMEDHLDNISRGEEKWIPMLEKFWKPFKEQVDKISETVSRQEVTEEKIDENCPKCGQPLAIKLGKYGRFITCTGYPDCKYKKSLNGEEEDPNEPEIVPDRTCPKCESPLQIKRGPYGKFIGCTSYPKCRFIESLEKPEEIQVSCPACKKGHFLKKKSRFGTFFYACSEYPECKYAISKPPIAESCPQCKWPILMIKETKRKGKEKVCPEKTCQYAISIEEPNG
jgi:DNA topoisomerase I